MHRDRYEGGGGGGTSLAAQNFLLNYGSQLDTTNSLRSGIMIFKHVRSRSERKKEGQEKQSRNISQAIRAATRTCGI